MSSSNTRPWKSLTFDDINCLSEGTCLYERKKENVGTATRESQHVRVVAAKVRGLYGGGKELVSQNQFGVQSECRVRNYSRVEIY